MDESEEPPKIQPANHDHEKTNSSHKYSSRSACAQVVATLIQNTLLIDIGMELAMPTMVIGALHRNTADKLCMSDDQASWFGSIPSFCHPIGSLTSGYLQEKFGRKGSMILVNIPLFAAWITLHLAESMNALYILAVLMGLCCGLSEAPLHSYIGEIGEPHLRGSLSTLSTSAAIIGVLLMYIIGYLFHWRTAALICSAVPIITIICMTQIPESPTWLIVRNRLEDAQKSLCWLRGWVKPEEVHEEFQDMVKYAQNSSKPTRDSQESVQSNGNATPLVTRNDSYLNELRVITDKKVWRPLRMIFIVFAINLATSLNGLKPFFVGILNEFGFPVDSGLILIMSGIVFFVGAMVNVVFLRRFGKRKIALLSQGVSTVSILFWGIYCSFYTGTNKLPSLLWVPIILIVIINFFGGFCITLLPWQLVCEVFPPMGRGTATGISAAWAHFVLFLMSKSYLYLEAWLKLSGVLYLYGTAAGLGFVYHYYYLPETEGKSLEQIETYFTKNYDRKEKFSMGKSV